MRRVMTDLGEGAGEFGLIHADLHLGNVLFWRGEVRVIDFDDCGFGYWLYDIAVALWELRYRTDYEDFRSALIEGYTQHRPLPPGGLTISMTSSLPARSRSACGSPAPRRSTPPSAPNSARYKKKSAARWTSFSEAEPTASSHLTRRNEADNRWCGTI